MAMYSTVQPTKISHGRACCSDQACSSVVCKRHQYIREVLLSAAFPSYIDDQDYNVLADVV